MNRRLFLLGSGSLLVGTWTSLQAQPTPEEPRPLQPPVNPASPARADQEIDKALIDDTDIGPRRVDEDEASPSDVRPPDPRRESAPLEPGGTPHADVPPSLAPSAPPYAEQGILPGGCMPCQPPPVACPPQPCAPVCYPRRRRHHRRRRGCW